MGDVKVGICCRPGQEKDVDEASFIELKEASQWQLQYSLIRLRSKSFPKPLPSIWKTRGDWEQQAWISKGKQWLTNSTAFYEMIV